jgi:hypothetical protein
VDIVATTINIPKTRRGKRSICSSYQSSIKLFFLKYCFFIRHSAAFEGMSIWMSSQGHPWASRWKQWNGQQSLLSASWYTYTGDWLLILAQFRRKKGKEFIPGVGKGGNQPVWGHSSPFKCSGLVLLTHRVFSVLKTSFCDSTSPGSSECSYCVHKPTMSHGKGFGTPQETIMPGYVVI